MFFDTTRLRRAALVFALTCASASASLAQMPAPPDEGCQTAICAVVQAEREALQRLFEPRALFRERLDAALTPPDESEAPQRPIVRLDPPAPR